MFLKSLTLKGFKSFADTTTLDLEPGVTVVVGPNGSGKSNVVDAVAWVLGAQASRTIRSNKMEDVIFAGTSKRAALGRAEVSLTIDNHSGVLPIGFTEVTITRTLYRSGESEYQINGVSCRLLDIQELLSDTGVGRQQHVIVSQGQLAAILDARPEDRRAVIEEAAGVLKYRRRRERAQRRLESTESNFMRLGDLLRELRRQLRPLERQADAARRHDGLADELRGLRVYLAGQEYASLQAKAEHQNRQRADLSVVEAELRNTLERLDRDMTSAESALSAAGGGVAATTAEGLPGWDGIDIADALARCEALYQKARGLLAFLGERRRSIERDRNSFLDKDVVATLEAEAARIVDELDRVERETMVLPPQFEELGEQEEALTADRARFLDDWGLDEGPTNDGPTAAQIRSELNGARQNAGAIEQEISKLTHRLASLDDRLAKLTAEAEQVELGLAGDAGFIGDDAITAAMEQRRLIEVSVVAADAALSEAQDSLRADEGEEKSWAARAEALTTALDSARAKAGAKRLAGIEGIVGTLLDLVDIDAGYEACVEAALGESISAVVVRDAAAARAALAKLTAANESGAVLALDALRASVGISAGMSVLDAPQDLAASMGDPVRQHVRARNVDASALLDHLLANAVLVEGNWVAALDVAVAHPSAVVVTRTGDRFSAQGWRAGSGAVGATGAALEDAQSHLKSARTQAATSQDALNSARAEIAFVRRSLVEVQAAEQQLVRDRDRATNRQSTLTNQATRIATDLADRTVERESISGQIAEAHGRLEKTHERVSGLDAQLPALIEAEVELAARQARRRDASQRLDERARAIATLRRDLEVQAAGLEERTRVLGRRQIEIEERLSRSIAERQAAEIRRIELDLLAERTEALHAIVLDRAESIEIGLVALRDERRRQSEAARAATGRLDSLRRERGGAEKQMSETRERMQRIELDLAESRMRLENLVLQIRREFEMEPELTLGAECPELPVGVTSTGPAARVADLERELRLMGPINPLALEEFTELQQRNALIDSQLDDVKSSRRELTKVITAIDEEIVTVFGAAYADVEENFEKLFGMLFPGGSGRLRLTEPDDLLNTGIEVEARPSGKNVRKLSLLSGGERSLTALAFLFAVFRSRPSPFYLMDEVEAALDDVNLSRFLGLIAEFRNEAQLLIVSHQKRTMEAADLLYGVTMQPGGSSRVVSEKVRKVEPSVAVNRMPDSVTVSL
jgi:chromosome segregation protein